MTRLPPATRVEVELPLIDVKTLREAVDPSSLNITKPVRAELDKVKKIRSFGTDPGGAALLRGSALLAIYGDKSRNMLLARSLHVPDSTLPHIQRTRQRAAYATAFYASYRGSVVPSVAQRTFGWTVKSPLLEGKALRHHIDRSPEEREMDEFMPVSGHLDLYSVDLAILSTMWLFGGSEAWPILRIEDEWERNASAIRELPGYSID